MNLGKCSKCGKSVYEIEGLTAGPPNKTKIYHKICFKCYTCGWQLNLTNYKFWEDQPYCKNHYPVTGFGDGTNLHVKGNEDINSINLQTILNVPKLGVINEQIRISGETKNTQTLDIASKNALNTPKLDTFNQTVRLRHCTNCGISCSSNYCANCGQKLN
jgi:hypothetical protein